ncbi:MAG: DUF599 family protein [Stappiaceae bacterium]
MTILSNTDIAAILWFALSWIGFVFLVDRSRWAKYSLTSQMNAHRHHWMMVMAEREVRIMDAGILSGLQNGTAFFASASLLAMGGCFALLDGTDLVLRIIADLKLGMVVTRTEWEVKVIGLIAICAYALFKFGWSYRLFNYCSILVGAVPERDDPKSDSETRKNAAERAARLNVIAGHHFNLGLRAFFFSVAYIGWFGGPYLFVGSTTLVTLTLVRRQFFSRSLKTVSVLPSSSSTHSSGTV